MTNVVEIVLTGPLTSHQALDSHPGSNFVVLLAHTKLLSFKGLYACSGEEDGVVADRVFGLGPPKIDATVVSSEQREP